MGKRIFIACIVIILTVMECTLFFGCSQPDTYEPETIVVMLPKSDFYSANSYIKEISKGENVSFRVFANDGYEIVGSTAGTYNNETLTLKNVQCPLTVHLTVGRRTALKRGGASSLYIVTTESDFDGKLIEGERGAVVIEPIRNYYIDSVVANGVTLDDTTDGFTELVDGRIRYECVMPSELDLSVSVLGNDYTLSLSCNDKGSAYFDVPVGTVHYGDKVTLTVTPNKNCRLNYVRVNDVVVMAPYTFTVTGNMSVEVNFIDVTSVSLTYNANGGTLLGSANGGSYNVDTVVQIDHCYNKFSRTGYVLTGLNTAADGSGEAYSLGAMMWLYDSDVTLYAMWEKETPSSAFKYTKSASSVTVNGLNDTSLTKIVIPEKIDGLPVTAIAANAFKGGKLTEIVTNTNITSIGSGAMQNCASLRKVTLFDSLRSMPSNPFQGCHTDIRVHINSTSAPDKSNLYEGSIVDRWMNLKRKNRPSQFITVSGSSGSCGINAKEIIDELNMEPNIFGVQQMLGTRQLMSMIAPHVREGDIVVLCPEYLSTAYSMVQGRTDLNYTYINRNYDMVPLFNYSENSNLFGDLGNRFKNKNSGAVGNNNYKIDRYGIRDYYRGDKSADWYYSGEMVDVRESLIGEGIEIMKKYARIMRANGAKVYFSFAPANSRGFTEYAKSLTNRQNFVAKLRTALNGEIPIISDMEDYFYPGNFFFDSNYHLSTRGALVRTQQLVADVKAMLAKEGAV